MAGQWSLGVALSVFAGAAIVTILAGWRLSGLGDVLADRLGLGEAIFGAVFFGAIISLSGIVMTATAGAHGHAGLAYGNAVGGVAAQTAALGVADLVYRGTNLEHAAASLPNMIFATLVLALLTTVVLIGLLPNLSLLGIHPGSIALVVMYFAGLRVITSARRDPQWRPEQTRDTVADEPDEEAEAEKSTARLMTTFVVLGALVSGGGWAVATSAATIVEKTGFSATFVGAALMGITNALPEMITSIAAVRRGAVTLAISGVLGGNALDVLNVAVGDVAFRDGSIYHAIANEDSLMTVVSILMTAIILGGLLRRQRKGPANIGAEGIVMLTVWIGALVLVGLR